MRISLDKFSFDAPPGFEDVTSYTFKDQRKRGLLTVTFGARPVEAHDLHSLLAIRRANLEMALAGDAKIEAESDVRVDGLPGRMLSFQFEDAGEKYRDRWAVALPGPDTYLQISYVALADDEEASHRFQHILASVVPARKQPPTTSPPGFVRRWAKRMSLDVPAVLAPPRTYQFVSKNGTTLTLRAYSSAPTMQAPTEMEERAEDAAGGTELGETERLQFRGPNAEGLVVTYPLTSHDPARPEREVVRRAYLSLSGGISVHIAARAPLESAEMEPAFQRLIKSIQPSRRTHGGSQ